MLEDDVKEVDSNERDDMVSSEFGKKRVADDSERWSNDGQIVENILPV